MRGQIIFGVQTWGPWKNSLIRQGNKGARGGPPLARNAKADKVRRALKFPAPPPPPSHRWRYPPPQLRPKSQTGGCMCDVHTIRADTQPIV